MTTIKEVARLAGVSVGTVSHVITGSHPVTDAMRARVESAIRKLDYQPNHIARSLKTRSTRTIGIIVPDLTISFFPQIIRGAEAAARAQGYSIVAVNSDDSAARQAELLSLMHFQRTDGILLIVATEPGAPVAAIENGRVPTVFVDRIPERGKFDSVSGDDQNAARIGVEHLIEKGYKHIAIVTGPLALKNERWRLEGYKDTLQAAGRATPADLIWEGNLRMEDVAALCRHRLTAMKTRPDAILATNGPTGMGVLRALREEGIRVPAQMGFVTFDEIVVDGIFEPSITTIVQPAFDIGFRAAKLLLQRIAGETPAAGPITLRLAAELKIRASSSTPATRTRR